MKYRLAKSFLALKWLVFFIIIFTFNKVFSNPADSLKNFKAGILPSAFYTPETRLGFGGLIYTHFKLGRDDSITRKSNTQSYISYTLNKQFAFENDYQAWLKKNLIYLIGAIDYSRFPEFFYGIGNDTRESDRIMVSFDLVRVLIKNLIQIEKKLYGGILFHYQNLYNQDVKLMSNASCMEVYGNMGYNAAGIGPVFILDNRDNPLNPSKGSYLEASYVDFKNIINNKNMFTSLTIDVRKYFTFYKKLIWNGNIYFSYNKGEVPYRMLPEIGGARFLRGYYRGRFRDNNMLVIQQEFRMPVYKIFGLAVFGGLGEVAKTIPQLKTNEIHYNYGAGIRIRVNKKENTNIRIDYGLTKDSHGFYVVFAEAF
ncbi:MAG: BamA/TamA family outer membrane protein [Bacteroidota bacterium]